MVKMNALLSLSGLLLLAACVLGQNDQTLQPGASGSSVVESVVDQIESACIFSEDKLFTRRTAYVESIDGIDNRTYRANYHGGIWQVDQAKFDATKSKPVELGSYYQDISNSFSIDWNQASWSDLRKPLYSALAFRLFLTQKTGSEDVPRSISEQADFWKAHYRPSNNRDEYIQKATTLENACTKAHGPDMVFVLDASGSIGNSNFQKIRTFVKEVVKAFDIGRNKTQISVVTYASAVRREFYLNRYSTKNEILQAVDRIIYTGGGTRTDLAIDYVINNVMTEANGARPLSQGHPRVSLVLTDGRSNTPILTRRSAQRAHSTDLTTFAIGVGSNVDPAELQVIASNPTCMHVFYLDNFNGLDSLVSTIEKKTCDAPIILNPGNNGSSIGGTLPPGENQNCKLRVTGASGTTVKVYVSSGSANFYLSETTYPNDAYYSAKISAKPGTVAVIYVPAPSNGQDMELFCNIQGNGTQENNITIGVDPGDKHWCSSNPCVNGGSCQDTGNSYTCHCRPGYTGQHCENEINHCASNPCNNGQCINNPAHGYTCRCNQGWTGANCNTPIDHCQSSPCVNGQCVNSSQGYTCNCNQGWTGTHCEIPIDYCQSKPCVNGQCVNSPQGYTCNCNQGWTGTHCEIPIDYCNSNPCVNGQCTNHPGSGYTCQCSQGYTGTNCENEINHCESSPCVHGTCTNNPSGYTCTCDSGYTGTNCEQTAPSGGYNCGDKNPCTPENLAAHRFYHPHEDPNKFVQCSQWGQCYEMPCPPGLTWNQSILTCT